jgi:hypothetical protein
MYLFQLSSVAVESSVACTIHILRNKLVALQCKTIVLSSNPTSSISKIEVMAYLRFEKPTLSTA